MQKETAISSASSAASPPATNNCKDKSGQSSFNQSFVHMYENFSPALKESSQHFSFMWDIADNSSRSREGCENSDKTVSGVAKKGTVSRKLKYGGSVSAVSKESGKRKMYGKNEVWHTEKGTGWLLCGMREGFK